MRRNCSVSTCPGCDTPASRIGGARNDAECTHRAGRSALASAAREADNRNVETNRSHLAPPPVAAMRLPRPVWLDEDATLQDAARVMASAPVSAVIVGHDAAILTERDLVCAVARGDAPETPALRLATQHAARFSDDGPVVAALAEMLHAGVRHLVIVDGEGLPCAVLSLSAAAAFVLDLSEIPSWVSALRIVLRVEEH